MKKHKVKKVKGIKDVTKIEGKKDREKQKLRKELEEY